MLAGCENSARDTPSVSNVGRGEVCKAVDYGNNILYFPCIEAPFANSLAKYLRENKNKDVTAMTSNGTGANGYPVGYFVIVHPAEITKH